MSLRKILTPDRKQEYTFARAHVDVLCLDCGYQCRQKYPEGWDQHLAMARVADEWSESNCPSCLICGDNET